MNIPDNFSESLETRFWVLKEINSFMRIQCCGSGMFIPDPTFYPSRIPDPGVKKAPDPGSGTLCGSRSGIFLTLDPGYGMEKLGSGIRHKHPGSATLLSW
jgi:hypothetical protein